MKPARLRDALQVDGRLAIKQDVPMSELAEHVNSSRLLGG
jgi:hypothetical protein